MHTETNTNSAHTSQLSLKLASLRPKRRATNQATFAEHYDAILAAFNRGVSSKDIREALADEGIKVSSATFKKLLNAERQRPIRARSLPPTQLEKAVLTPSNSTRALLTLSYKGRRRHRGAAKGQEMQLTGKSQVQVFLCSRTLHPLACGTTLAISHECCDPMY